MKQYDPYWLVDLVPVSEHCPARLKYLVQYLKAMVLYGNANLKEDAKTIKVHLLNWFNNSSPQFILWKITFTEAEINALYDEVLRFMEEYEDVR